MWRCVGRRLVTALVCCPVLVRCSFVSVWKITVDPVQIESMTFVPSTLQIRRHGYSENFNIVKYVGLCNVPFYAINTDAVSLFADSSFLFLAILNLYCIDVLLSIWMNEYLLFSQKKTFIIILTQSQTPNIHRGVHLLHHNLRHLLQKTTYLNYNKEIIT